MDLLGQSIKLVVTGSPYHVSQVSEIVFSEPPWESQHFELAGLRRRPFRLLKFLALLRSVDGWYHIGGQTLPLFHSLKLLQIARAFGTSVVIRWIGNDVLTMGPLLKRHPSLFRTAELATHWTSAPWLAEELKSFGLDSSVMLSTSRRRASFMAEAPPPLPERFSVLSYIPHDEREFYGWPLVERLAKDFPLIEFTVVHGSKSLATAPLENIRFLDWVDDIHAVYKNASLLVRMTEHDGHSNMVQEALLLGRHVIWTYPFPGARLAKSYEDLSGHVGQLWQQHQAGRLALNLVGREYMKQQLDPATLAAEMRRKMAGIIASRNSNYF